LQARHTVCACAFALACAGGCSEKQHRPTDESPPPRAEGDTKVGTPAQNPAGRRGPRNDVGKRGDGAQFHLGRLSAATAGLAWLAAHQEPDGRWKAARYGGAEGMDGMVTGLAALAFLASGHNERIGRYRVTVAKALGWIRAQQREDGLIDCGGGEPVFRHLVCGVALGEGYSMSRLQETLEPVRRAAGYTTNILQRDGSGWSWSADDEPNTLATCWAVMQLKSAKIAGVEIDEDAFAGAGAWLDLVTDAETGATSFRSGDDATPAMTAAALMVRLLMGARRKDATVAKGAARITERLPEWKEGERDFLYWYLGTLVMFQAGYRHWKPWNAAFRPMLKEHVRTDGDLRGSWDTGDGWSADGGRVASTAFAIVCLNTYSCYYIERD